MSRPREPPAPRALQVGEHVLCTITPSSPDAPVDAVVVALDPAYCAAARRFAAPPRPASPPPAPSPPPSPPPPAPALPNGFAPPPRILFCEEHTAARPAAPPAPAPAPASAPPPPRPKRRRGALPPAAPHPPALIRPDDAPAPHPIAVGRVYVHFSGRDRRLDRWAAAAELERASASAVARAASGVVANTLVDHAAAAEFAVAPRAPAHHRKLTRARRRAYEEVNPMSEREMGNDALLRMEKAREEKTKVRNISSIVLGDYVIDAWYYSPFPLNHPVDVLYMCGKCLKYVHTARQFVQHCTKCTWHHTLGFRIYHDPHLNLSVYEVSGFVNPAYCQRLCLLGKLFLDHKTLFFDTSPFLFYVVTLNGELAGYFSKEHPIVRSEYNLACILTLPHQQKKGIGRFLISLSYELTKRQRKTASPERPLSDLGQLSYRSYWAYAVTQYLQTRRAAPGVSAKDVAVATGIRTADVVSTLKSVNLVSIWKGETFADTSPKALDAALERVSHPRITLYTNYLQPSVYAAAPPAPTNHTPRTPGAGAPPRKRSKALKSADKAKMSSDPLQPVPKREAAPQVELEEEGRFRPLAQLLDKYGPGRVLARLNTADGLPSHLVQAVADEVGVTLKHARFKLSRMAKARLALGNPARPLTSDSQHPRQSTAILDEAVSNGGARSRDALVRGNNRTVGRPRNGMTDHHNGIGPRDSVFSLGSPVHGKRHRSLLPPSLGNPDGSLQNLSGSGGVRIVEDSIGSYRGRQRETSRRTQPADDSEVVVVDSQSSQG